MKTYIVTGGSGFFGSILKKRLLESGNSVVNIDIHEDEDRHPNLESVQADIADRDRMAEVFGRHRVDGVFHAAAELAHAVECEKITVEKQCRWNGSDCRGNPQSRRYHHWYSLLPIACGAKHSHAR